MGRNILSRNKLVGKKKHDIQTGGTWGGETFGINTEMSPKSFGMETSQNYKVTGYF